jgi:O-antigen/teichoic acid export membrane protein
VSISGVILPFLVSFDQFVIGSVLGVAAVTHYAVPMNLVTRSQIFPGALVRTLFPRLSSSAPMEATTLASRALVALAYGYSVVCAPAIVLTPIFFRYWIGIDFSAIASPVAELLFFGAWINAIAFVPYILLNSQGRPDITGKCHLAQLVPFIAILWVMTSAFGIIGAAAAYSIRCAVDTLCMYWASGMPKRDLLKSLFPLAFLLVSAAIAKGLAPGPWAAFCAATCIFITSAALALVVSRDLRNATLTLFRVLQSSYRRSPFVVDKSLPR